MKFIILNYAFLPFFKVLALFRSVNNFVNCFLRKIHCIKYVYRVLRQRTFFMWRRVTPPQPLKLSTPPLTIWSADFDVEMLWNFSLFSLRTFLEHSRSSLHDFRFIYSCDEITYLWREILHVSWYLLHAWFSCMWVKIYALRLNNKSIDIFLSFCYFTWIGSMHKACKVRNVNKQTSINILRTPSGKSAG